MADDEREAHRSVDNWLDELAATRPRTARRLLEARSRREIAAAKWQPSGRRLTGLEQLLTHLDAVRDRLTATRRERVIAPLVDRMARDFETAIEAGLSGYTSVALDAMRDVMEATDLILMFSTDVELIEQWVLTPPANHWRRFSPRAVRKYLMNAGLKYTESARASVDYQGHSMALHVNPWNIPFAQRGLADELPLADDAPYWEIFTHGRELVFALERLREHAGFDLGDLPRAEDLSDLADAYEAAKEMEAVFLALMEAVSEDAQRED